MPVDRLRLFSLIALTSGVWLAGCDAPAGPDGVPVVQLAEHTAPIVVGDSLALHLLGLPVLPPGYIPSVNWSSSNPAVATVSPRGGTAAVAEGLMEGEVFIVVSGDGARDSILVTVTSPGP